MVAEKTIEPCHQSDWAAPLFVIAKENNRVRQINDFCELNKVIKRGSSERHQGVSFFLSYDELISLIEYIQPAVSNNDKKAPTINYKTFCNFFGF